MANFNQFFNRLRIITTDRRKQPDIFWKQLVAFFKNKQWKYGVFENERYIEATFNISEEFSVNFIYTISDTQFRCFVKLNDDFPTDLIPDMFILASHFNNIFNLGRIVVNPSSHFVIYEIRTDILPLLLYPEDIEYLITLHYTSAKDVFKSFQKLFIENEPPALIIADLLKERNEQGDSAE